MNDHFGYKAFIFDLDGTLLNTLPDLVNVTNMALAAEGFPPHSPEQILAYIGDGAASLISQAVPEDASQEEFERTFKRFKNLYHEFGVQYTTEFEGMNETLQKLKDSGIKLGIMSNKFEQGVLDVTDRFFSDLIDIAHGESEDIPRKPDPIGLLKCAEEMGVDPDDCLFVGDSASDIHAGHNAGMKAAAVKWGYQPQGRLMASNPDHVLEHPEDMLALAAQ